jgi:hypothetical protein
MPLGQVIKKFLAAKSNRSEAVVYAQKSAPGTEILFIMNSFLSVQTAR